MLEEIDENRESFFERNLVDIISFSVCTIVIIIISTFWMQVQIMETVSRQAHEIRLLRQDQLTDRARIRELAAEQDWVRSSVKIQMEMMK